MKEKPHSCVEKTHSLLSQNYHKFYSEKEGLGMVIELDAVNFNSEVLQSKTPVMVDFWAAWCGPCKLLAPLVEEMEKDFKGRLKFAKMNVDDFSQIAQSYDIASIPCMILFSKGKEVDRIVGLSPKAEMKKLVESALKKA